MDWRKAILNRIKERGDTAVPWVLDVYGHLIGLGAPPDEANEAMSAFVDEIVATRARLKPLELVHDRPPVAE